ncbi:hypothetical protein [Candidatus Chlamydia corallus]|uniref:hypothetical protein n=1 Tax=Candidatus Chlamydia corallus TaxID=2038470 RepID=UPI000C2FEA20|nr:hypothetical protein [Candidatus Chlamydia corallus]
MATGRIENSSQILIQDSQEVLINKQFKDSFRCRILAIAVAVVTFVAGVVLLALTVTAILAFVPYLVLAALLLLTALACVVFAVFSIPSPISHKEEIVMWFKERKNIDLQKEKEDPDHFGRNITESQCNPLEAFNNSCYTVRNSPTLTEIYDANKNIFFFKDWGPSTFPDVNAQEELLIRTVVGSYLLIEAAVPKLPMLVNELTNHLRSPLKYESLFKKKEEELRRKAFFLFSNRDLATFFLAYTPVYDGYLTLFRAGAKQILVSYLNLRRNRSQKDFFTPGHSCYYARLAFNQTRQLYRQIFNVRKLASIYANKDKDTCCYPWAFIPIYNLLKTEDLGDGFLEQQDTTASPNRSDYDNFFG